MAIAALAPDTDTRPLIRHLRASGQLTAGLVLRALLSGNVAMFEDVLAELSGLPLAKERFEREMAEHRAKLAVRDEKTAAIGKKPGGNPPCTTARGSASQGSDQSD